MKKIVFWLCLWFSLMLFMATHGAAEFYQYKDSDGNIVFTDDLSQVPVDQRKEIKSFDSVQPSEQLSVPEHENSGLAEEKNEQLPDSVSARRQQLEKEYNRLREMRRILMDEKNQVKTLEDQKVFNEKVNQLNEQINQFSQQIQKFNESVSP